ncbi:MAG: hemolysin III family protein [Armatimonadaceae bacterium]
METLLQRLKHYFKHPFSGLSHLAGAVFAVVGLVLLLIAAEGKPWHTLSFAVYGFSLILLYTASALYHLLRLPPSEEERLYGLDRAAIYMLIAGTYTPVCLLALPPVWGWSLLGVVWTLAIAGIVIDVVSRRRTPDWLQALLYLLTGWVVLAALGPLLRSLSVAALCWLGAGCLIYTVGAVICVTNRPRLRPGFFDAHDLWHVLVLAGSACHFILMLCFLAPR